MAKMVNLAMAVRTPPRIFCGRKRADGLMSGHPAARPAMVERRAAGSGQQKMARVYGPLCHLQRRVPEPSLSAHLFLELVEIDLHAVEDGAPMARQRCH